MIKNTILLLILFCAQFGFAQVVGIGTKDPAAGTSLDVNGSMLVQKNLKLPAYTNTTLTNLNYQFLVRKLNSTPPGEVARLDLTNLDVAPINVADYVFTNTNKDDVIDANLQYDSSKYIVGLSNVRHVGAPIIKGTATQIGNFVARTFVSGGTWHLEIRNRTRNATANNTITYYVTLLIYDRNYFKELEPIKVNMGGSNTGSTAIPAGL